VQSKVLKRLTWKAVFLAVDNALAKSPSIELPASGAWDGRWGTIVVRGAGPCKSETRWLCNRRRVVIKENPNIWSNKYLKDMPKMCNQKYYSVLLGRLCFWQ
jgi:hypothetical protein